MNHKYSFLLLILLLISGCKSLNKCDDYACFTPPPEFIFELIDIKTGENLFTNGTLASKDIIVKDENNADVSYQFITENNLDVINLSSIGWNTEISNYKLTIGANLTIDFKLVIEKVNENCCTYFRILEFTILDYEFEQLNTTGIIQIKI